MPARSDRAQLNQPTGAVDYRLAPPPRRGRSALLLFLLPVLFLLALVGGVLAGGLAFVYARERVLPGVTALGVPLGGQTAEQAAATLQARWAEQPLSLIHI